MKKLLIALPLFTFYQCQTTPEVPEVYAQVETEQVIALEGEDAADDPAFWLHPEHPEQSLVFGSNKKLGLEAYTLEGKRLASFNTGRLNNIDVALQVPVGDTVFDIVAGSNRDFDRIDIWAINEHPEELMMISDTNFRTNLQGVYGFCLWNDTKQNKTYAFVNNKDGAVEQWQLRTDSLPIQFDLVRSFSAAGQVEGMVVDTTIRMLYLGEEQGGIFAYSLDLPNQERIRIEMSGKENADLAYDIEGLTVHYGQNEHWLIASSQGNNRYAIFDIGHNHRYLGVFAIGTREMDGNEDTDGIDVYSSAIGSTYPEGVFIAQDGYNKDQNGTAVPQNFKLIDWRDISVLFQEQH